MRSFSPTIGLTAVAVLIASCGSGVRGGVLTTPSSVPKGKLVATFLRAECTDKRDQSESIYVDYVQGEDGAPFLVERSRASDWLVVTNSYLESGEIVFQALRETRGRALHEYRFPWDGRTAGRYALAMSYAEPKGTRDRFRVESGNAHVRCTLRRVDPVSGATLDVRDASDGKPTALPGPALSAQGWGYDGKSFVVGDRVLVDVHGKATRARVVQASGTAYYVEIEGSPPGAGEWVAPAKILGRVK